TIRRRASSRGWYARPGKTRSSGSTSSRTNTSAQSSFSWNSGSVSKSHAIAVSSSTGCCCLTLPSEFVRGRRSVELEGKVAIVTGASRGVGAATAVALGQAGCAVACAARSTADHPQRTPGTLDETVRRVEAAGARGLAVPTNLADEADVAAMVATTVEHFGRVDILVNNAAITFVGDLDIPMKRHDLVMEVNLRAPLIAIREVKGHM